MKQAIFILIFFTFGFSADAQQERDPTLVKPVAYDRNFILSSPHKPKQVFIVQVQNANGDLLKVIYFPKTDGLRGGVTEFVGPKTLSSKTLWKIKLRQPVESESIYCKTDNFLSSSSDKISFAKEKEPVLRFRSTQFDAFIQFNNFEKMPCMILDSNYPPKNDEGN